MSLELDEQFKLSAVLGKVKKPKFVDFLLKHGIVNSEKQAEIVLIIFAVCAFLVSIVIAWNTLSEDYQELPPLQIDSRVNRN